MIVNNVNGASGASDVKKKKKTPSRGDFAAHLNATEGVSESVGEVGAINSVNSLFMLQEVESDLAGKGQAVSDGFDAIEYLEKIRIGILTGDISESMLKNLGNLVGSWRKNFDDPQLEAIIDDIELRAAVELAKLKSI